jgi:hypothetical protein
MSRMLLLLLQPFCQPILCLLLLLLVMCCSLLMTS